MRSHTIFRFISRKTLRKMSSVGTPSPNFRVINKKFAIDGVQLDEANLAYISANYKGALYLCTDMATDICAAEGFPSIQNSISHAERQPVDIKEPEFMPGSDASPYQIIGSFMRFKEKLDCLPLPAVIVCKSANRASAIYAAYKGVTENLCKEEIFEWGQTENLKFVSSPAMSFWVGSVLDLLTYKNQLVFRQLFESESSTYTYLLADKATKEAVIIDPVVETVERDTQVIKELGFTLKYAINTHVHADHITGSGMLKTTFPGCKSILAEASGGKADIHVKNDDVIEFGSRCFRVLATPGHTSGCVSLALDDLSMVFTGDALLIRGCGRTDFQGGSAKTLFHSVKSQLFGKLPDSCIVYPAHDYQGRTSSSIFEEKNFNLRLGPGSTEESFTNIMDNLNLSYPKQIDKAVPANMYCGSSPEEAK